MTEEDHFLLARAVAEGLLSKDQADDCQTLARMGEGKRPAREILVEKRLVPVEQVERIAKLFRIHVQEREDRVLARYLSEKARVKGEDLQAALAAQKQARAGGKYVPLGKVLVSRNTLHKDQLQEIEFSSEFHAFLEREKHAQAAAQAQAAPPRAEEKAGSQRVGNYEIRAKIATGGMGTIYRAWQAGLEREVALKVLSTDLAAKPEFVKKFLREAKMAARLCHPNLVHIYDIGEEGGRPWYSMELVEGTNLHEILVSEDRLPKERAIDILLQIAKALRAVHEQGIIHRDIKPDNVIIRKDGIAKLVDLGLATESDPARASKDKVMGNPYYIAPEVVTNPGAIDFRADIYSLGATFYRMITGKRPVEGKTPEEIVQNLVSKEPTPIQEIDHTLSDDISKICRRMMAKDPAKRYMSMDMVIQSIEKLFFMD